METRKLTDFFRGWIIGDFEPSVLRTKEFEVGLVSHKKDEFWPNHVHKISTEFNVLVSGKMSINNIVIEPKTIFIIKPGEASKAIFLEDCEVLVIKTPSIPNDKYEVHN